MNKVMREHYPVSNLPEDLRQGLDPLAEVTVTVEEEERPRDVLSIREMFALRKPPYRSKEEIDDDLRALRDEWKDRG